MRPLTNSRSANIFGLAAMALWAGTSALLTYTESVPAILTAALSCLFGFAGFIVYWIATSRDLQQRLRVPLPGLLLAVIGIGGYRLLYFSAFEYSPAVEVSLINYLWPILIVLFAALLPNEPRRWRHVAGAFLGFAGVGVLLLGDGATFKSLSVGHELAFAAAIVWAAFSILRRRIKSHAGDVPVSLLAIGFGLLTIYYLEEPPTVAISLQAWLAIGALGISSSLGYFLWDVAVKHGDIQMLSVVSYATPLASTGLLIALGKADASPSVLLAAGLVGLGGIVGAWGQARRS